MSKLYLYAAGAALIVLVVIGIYSAGKHSGKLEVAHKLDQLEIKRQKDITALTLVVTDKQKVISSQRRKNQEIIRNAKDVTNCDIAVIPAPVADSLR